MKKKNLPNEHSYVSVRIKIGRQVVRTREEIDPEAEGLQERTVGADFLNVPSWSRRGTWEPGGRMLRTLRSSMMTPIFLILITNKIYTMTIAINQWISLFSIICNPCYSGTFDNKIVFWRENVLLEIFWYWYTTWTLYGNRGMCLEAGNIILRAVVPKTVISLFRDMISHNKVAWLQMIWYPRYLFYF